MKYMDEANFGFSHFDVDTQEFQIEGIFFDIYHLKISQTRKLLNFLRLFDQALSCDMQKKSVDCWLSLGGDTICSCGY